jgi:hypothetical protein
MRLSLPLAIGVVMLMTASADAHSRVFVGARVGVPAHPIVVAPSAVVVSPGFLTASAFHGVPRGAFVITSQRAIRPGIPVIVTRRSATFFPQTVVVSPSVPDALPLHVTVPPRRVGPKVILVEPTGSTRQR